MASQHSKCGIVVPYLIIILLNFEHENYIVQKSEVNLVSNLGGCESISLACCTLICINSIHVVRWKELRMRAYQIIGLDGMGDDPRDSPLLYF